MQRPSLRTRLNCESMEAREVMSVNPIDPGLVMDQTPAMVVAAAPQDAIPLAAPRGRPLPRCDPPLQG